MSSALLSVLLVYKRRILRHRCKFSNMFILIRVGQHVRHFSVQRKKSTTYMENSVKHYFFCDFFENCQNQLKMFGLRKES
jgi:hypothetical protein